MVIQDYQSSAALPAANRSYHSCLRATAAAQQQMAFSPDDLSRLLAHLTQQQQSTGQAQARGQVSQSQSRAQRQGNGRQQQQTSPKDWLNELYGKYQNEAMDDDKALGKGASPWCAHLLVIAFVMII